MTEKRKSKSETICVGHCKNKVSNVKSQDNKSRPRKNIKYRETNLKVRKISTTVIKGNIVS